jgi:ATP-dependent helicase HrpB
MTIYPVLAILPQLKEAFLRCNRVVLQAPPGAGKSTVLPLELLDESWLRGKKIILLEPRRLAARSVANRMAVLREETIGQTIGYRIRFETAISPTTRIEVVTEGILTNMIQRDPTLEGIGLVILDEFHERSLQADLALALCLQAQELLRKDLRLLIMSATLEGEKISAVLGNAPVISSAGKQYPVDVRYENIDPDAPLPVRMTRAIRKAVVENEGDILAFLPGAGEIKRTMELLKMENTGATVHALYGDLPMKKQQEAIMPDPHGRKIVLATSIAETSLTIEGITVVIDSGYSRVPKFDPRSGLSRLETIRVTRDVADQRAGRAGRLGPGVCCRLWGASTNAGLVPHRVPEIADADLAALVLEIKQWGARDVRELTWMTMPPAGALAQANELLEQLDALREGKITAKGKEMLRLPTHPRLAHMLLSAKADPMLYSVAADIAAILEERDPLDKSAGADLTLRVEALRNWRSGRTKPAEKNVFERLERLAESWRRFFSVRQDNALVPGYRVGKLVAAAYPERIAHQVQTRDERFKLSNGRIVRLPSHDPLIHEAWLAVADVDAGKGEGRIFLAAPVAEQDLLALATDHESIAWDTDRGMVVGALERRIGQLVIETLPLPAGHEEQKRAVVCEAVRREGTTLLDWTEEIKAWQARVMSLRAWRPQESWPDVRTENLLVHVDEWLSPYLDGISKRSDLQRIDLKPALEGILPGDLRASLQRLAPSFIEVPSGSYIRLNYFEHGQAPVMEVRLQEVFGLLETPVVNDGKVKVMLHLLSPGYKPVQVTQDLHSFWSTTYKEVRKELRLRYRKHSWPEDPWTARAVRGPVKRRPS